MGSVWQGGCLGARRKTKTYILIAYLKISFKIYFLLFLVVDGRQSQRKGDDAFLRGASWEGQAHTSFKIFQRPFEVLQNTFQGLSNSSRMMIEDYLKAIC